MRTQLAVLGLLLVTSFACSFELHPPKNRIAWTDEYGNFRAWFDFPEIELSQGITFPVYFGYGGCAAWQQGNVLGSRWFIPLLECSAYQVSETEAAITLISGQEIRLFGNERLTSKDGEWTALVEKSKIILTGKSGWELTYEGGRIAKISPPGSKYFRVTRRDGRLTGLESSVRGEGQVLSVIYEKQDGMGELVKKLQYKKSLNDHDFANVISFGYEQVGKLTPIPGGHLVIEKKIPTLNSIESSDGYQAKFENKQSLVDGKISVLLKELVPGNTNTSKAKEFSWNADGLINSAEGLVYQVIPVKDAYLPKIERRKDGKLVDSYFFDQKTFVEHFEQESMGAHIEKLRRFSAVTGDNYLKLLSLETLKNGKQIFYERYYYSIDGALIKRSLSDRDIIYKTEDESKKASVFDNFGRVISFFDEGSQSLVEIKYKKP